MYNKGSLSKRSKWSSIGWQCQTKLHSSAFSFLPSINRRGCPPHPNYKHHQPITGRKCLPWQVQTGLCHTLTQETLFRQRHFKKTTAQFLTSTSYPRSLKKQWPFKSKPIFKLPNLTTTNFSPHTRPTIQRKLLYFLFRMIYSLQWKMERWLL